MVLFQHEGHFQVPSTMEPVYRQFAQQCKAEHDEVVRWVDCTFWEQNGMKRAASITNSAEEPAARAILVHRGFSFHLKMI
jgi:hypothetical protein